MSSQSADNDLPPGWCKMNDQYGVYYMHLVTKQTTRVKPAKMNSGIPALPPGPLSEGTGPSDIKPLPQAPVPPPGPASNNSPNSLPMAVNGMNPQMNPPMNAMAHPQHQAYTQQQQQLYRQQWHQYYQQQAAQRQQQMQYYQQQQQLQFQQNPHGNHIQFASYPQMAQQPMAPLPPMQSPNQFHVANPALNGMNPMNPPNALGPAGPMPNAVRSASYQSNTSAASGGSGGSDGSAVSGSGGSQTSLSESATESATALTMIQKQETGITELSSVSMSTIPRIASHGMGGISSISTFPASIIPTISATVDPLVQNGNDRNGPNEHINDRKAPTSPLTIVPPAAPTDHIKNSGTMIIHQSQTPPTSDHPPNVAVKDDNDPPSSPPKSPPNTQFEAFQIHKRPKDDTDPMSPRNNRNGPNDHNVQSSANIQNVKNGQSAAASGFGSVLPSGSGSGSEADHKALNAVNAADSDPFSSAPPNPFGDPFGDVPANPFADSNHSEKQIQKPLERKVHRDHGSMVDANAPKQVQSVQPIQSGHRPKKSQPILDRDEDDFGDLPPEPAAEEEGGGRRIRHDMASSSSSNHSVGGAAPVAAAAPNQYAYGMMDKTNHNPQKVVHQEANWEMIIEAIRGNCPLKDQYSVFKAIRKVAQNLLIDDDKYRTLYADNDMVQQKILGRVGGYEFLIGIGFKQGMDDNELVCHEVHGPIIENAISALNVHIVRLKQTRHQWDPAMKGMAPMQQHPMQSHPNPMPQGQQMSEEDRMLQEAIRMSREQHVKDKIAEQQKILDLANRANRSSGPQYGQYGNQQQYGKQHSYQQHPGPKFGKYQKSVNHYTDHEEDDHKADFM